MEIIEKSAIENIRDLEEKTGRPLLVQLIELYKQSTPSVVIKMRDFLQGSAFVELGREAHSLKSSSANIGVHSIRDLSKQIELQIHEENFNMNELKVLINAIDDQIEDVFSALDDLITSD